MKQLSFLLMFLVPTMVLANFSDVNFAHPYYEAINYVQSEGIVRGYASGEYKPDQVINRAEFTKILIYATISEDIIFGKNCFKDVRQQWFAPSICIAKSRGIIHGYEDGTFRPEQTIILAEATKIITLSFGGDVSPTNLWYEAYINYLSARKAIPSTVTKPNQEITRGGMAEIIFRLNQIKKDQEAEENTLENSINSEMENQDIPALSILVFEGDKILYEEVFGTSKLVPPTSLKDTDLFLLASVSKVITATALLQLAEQGLFSLDDFINDFLPFEVYLPNSETEITFRMLLSHTSGIADGAALDDQYYYGADSPVDLSEFLESYLVPGGEFYDIQKNFHDFEPGTENEYSNVGNALMAVLVESISGLDFNEYCKQKIFRPLRMESTFWHLDEVNQNMVQPYAVDKEIEHYSFTDYPNGGLRSTAYDLFLFLSSLAGSDKFQVLKSNTVREMTTLQVPDLDPSQGLHLFLLDSQRNIWGHDGGEEGVSTIVGFNPDTQRGVIILTNQSDVDLEPLLIKTYELGFK
jgi:CubicO group peptidase (beta-lactamase class C family)